MPAVSYTIALDGEPLEDEILGAVSAIEVEDHALLADMLRIRLAIAIEKDGAGWTLLDDDVFPRLARLTVAVAIGSHVRETLIDAYVIESSVRLSAKPGGSSLDVVAMDPTVLLNLDEVVRAWPDMSDSDIAASIFAERGFAQDVETTEPQRQEVAGTTVQRGTDMRFLQRLAERNGFEVYVEVDPSTGETTGHFHAPRLDDAPQGTLSVSFGEATNVHSFAASFDMLRPAVVTAIGIGSGDQSEQRAEVESVAASTMGGGSVLPADRPRKVLLAGTGLTDANELQTAAQAAVDRSAWALVAQGELTTSAYGGVLRAKRPVNVRGAGRRFSGVWYVDHVLHRIEGTSYSQIFSLRRNAVGLSGAESFQEDDAVA
ncbi:MAG: hypothetical protein AAF628_19385 [Planctomycetota bacterium]